MFEGGVTQGPTDNCAGGSTDACEAPQSCQLVEQKFQLMKKGKND
jgi:hypothetical protein